MRTYIRTKRASERDKHTDLRHKYTQFSTHAGQVEPHHTNRIGGRREHVHRAMRASVPGKRLLMAAALRALLPPMPESSAAWCRVRSLDVKMAVKSHLST